MLPKLKSTLSQKIIVTLLLSISDFPNALNTFIEKNTALAQNVTETIGEKEGEIILGHIMMMKDPYMCSEIEKNIEA